MAGLFPETLKSEYYGIRKTIEAYSQNAIVSDLMAGNVNGICLQKGNEYNYKFRVTTDRSIGIYILDRWD